MKARGGKFLMILGAGLAALAFVVVYILMSRGSAQEAAQQAASLDQPEMRAVVVARGNVPAFAVLDSTNVMVVEKDASTVPTEAATSPEMVYQMMSTSPMNDGQAIVPAQLTKAGFSSVLVKGEKAFSYPVQENNAFADGITEGDRVDFLLTNYWAVNVPWREVDNKIKFEKGTYTTTKTLLQDIKVIRVVSLRAPVPRSDSQGSVEQTSTRNAPALSASAMYTEDAPYAAVLILAVTDQQAEVLKFAREHGMIDLTLRSSAVQRNPDGTPVLDAQGKEVRGDHDIEQTTGITMDKLVETYGLLAPPENWSPTTAP
jgi:Flp pilus assembly protein CpaB